MELFKDFIFNTTLLLSLSLIGNTFYLKSQSKTWRTQIIHGLIVGIIGIVLMLNTVELSPGLIFDTRSILVSTTGMFFGGIPTMIAVIIISCFRIVLGGAGAFTGILVTLLTAATGVIWHKYRFEKIKSRKYGWSEFYVFGLITHIIMILCMFTLPNHMAIETIKTIILPVLLIYPLGVLIICLISLYWQNSLVTKTMLKESEIRFEAIFNQAPVGIAIANKNEITFVNPKLEEIIGRSKDELSSMGWQEFTYPDDIAEDELKFSAMLSGEIDSYEIEKRYIRPDDSIIWTHLIISALKSDSPDEGNHICMAQDITDMVQSKQELQNSETKYKELYLEYLNKQSLLISLLDSIPDLIFYKDQKSIYMGCNHAFEQFVGLEESKIVGHTDFDIFEEKIASLFRSMDVAMLEKKAPRINEEEAYYPDGRKVVLETLKTPYYNEQGEILGLIGISRNITERKKKEKEILFLSSHDVLTGLHNRVYFEKALKEIDDSGKLPYSIIVGDINSLKLINDIFGHDQGDKLIKDSAALLKKCCRPTDMIARTGGDEFSIILPESDDAVASTLYDKIMEAFEKSSFIISNQSQASSISIGYATKSKKDDEISKIVKAAEEHMYRRKLLNNKSIHSSLLSTIKTTVFEKSHETEAHAERMVTLSKKVGLFMGLSQDELVDLELATTLHDLGKIGIDANIIMKPGKLTEDEWTEMKKHPEIGYRIAQTIPELYGIAEYILCHHEKWDGTGYPQGLKGDQIPIISRIISIVDSYDAMTEDRPYRKAMTKEAAVTEIIKYSGIQFDPQVVKIFTKIINNDMD